MFSDRTGWNRETASLAQAVEGRRRRNLPILDLTASNPTRCGFAVDAEATLAPLAVPEALDYDPQPFGKQNAREAVARYYGDRGATVSPGQICLTTSTSEGYSFLFRLLCDPGDEVLIASPSYPLFDYLAALDDVHLVSYPLVYEHGWHLEPHELERRITPRTRALVLVHPNNPTGHFVSASSREALDRLCAERNLALIVDEVFLDYPWTETRDATSFAVQGTRASAALTFVLSGLSKVAALPQMKLAWIVTCGAAALQREALARLELIADTFLSVSAPTQAALPVWVSGAQRLREQIRSRVRANLNAVDLALRGTAVSRLHSEGGWYAVLRVPALIEDETFCRQLLEEHGILVHPGSAFAFPEQGWLVVSLLAPVEVFRSGVLGLVKHVYAVQALTGTNSFDT